MSDTTTLDYDSMNHDELRAEIDKRNKAGADLRVSGTNSDLADRLREHDDLADAPDVQSDDDASDEPETGAETNPPSVGVESVRDEPADVTTAGNEPGRGGVPEGGVA